jgi:hypothetical protein
VEVADLDQLDVNLYMYLKYKNYIYNTIMDSIEPTNTVERTEPQQNVEQSLLNISIQNENDALNGLVGFVNLAQRRGCFNIPESAKIWECIQKFQKK